jgi:SAM-dependent methyltransferase
LTYGEFCVTDRALGFLLSPPGSALLAELAGLDLGQAALLGHLTRLRKTYPPDIAAAALDLAMLRDRAGSKFERAAAMFFTRPALEQASAEIVSRYRARRFERFPEIADLCCGIGGDALSLAQIARVWAIDVDPIRLRMAEANARACGVDGRLHTLCSDVTTLELPPGMPFWADPARRVEGRRIYRLEDYDPPLSALLRLAAAVPGAGIKLSPGVDDDELAALLEALPGDIPYEVELISVHHQAREAVLWIGELCQEPASRGRRRATLLPGPHTLVERPLAQPTPTTPPQGYLYDPDPAVTRAHLVEHLAQALGATKLDDQIAYLTAAARVETPFARTYRVEEWMPFQLKRLNRRLRAMDIGELIVKKRGFAVDPEQFRRRLKYGGGRQRVVLVLTHVQGQPAALLCREEP